MAYLTISDVPDRALQWFWDHTKLSSRGSYIDCWLWTASDNGAGYGHINLGVGKRTISAHRLSYAMFHGDIPPDKLVRHTCDNRSCVNPMHLVIDTQGDNIQDWLVRGDPFSHAKKLTPIDVTRIRQYYAEHKHVHGTMVYLARSYNVTHTTIHNIVTHKTWVRAISS